MAKSLGINIENKTDAELKHIIGTKLGTSKKNSETKFKN